MKDEGKTSAVLIWLGIAFLVLAVAFVRELWGKPPRLTPLAPVPAEFIATDTVRRSYGERLRLKDDVSEFDCYGCHDRKKPPVLRFDTNHNLIVPKEHEDIVMGHGSHNRNNLCFNCHNETNLVVFQTRDGRELQLHESTHLCGSCHGPTYRDWEVGIHGRTSGHWNRQLGASDRKECVSCHNPHSPKFPGRKPAPAPNPLRPGKHPEPAVHTKAH